MTKVLRSDCCEQPVTTQHAFTGYGQIPDNVDTMYYVCIKCKEPCTAIEMEVGDRDDKDNA